MQRNVVIVATTVYCYQLRLFWVGLQISRIICLIEFPLCEPHSRST